MNNNEKMTNGEISIESKALRWFDNFWYHYKWHTIIVSFFIIVFLICTLQMCTREVSDTTVLYAGPAYISAESTDNIERVFEAVMPDDPDGNGEKTVFLKSFHIYTKEQIEKIEAETDENGKHYDVDNAYVVENNEAFYDFVLAGESSICFLDPSLYLNLLSSGRLAELPTMDGEYGVTLGDTDIYEDYSVLKDLPEETVICLLKQNFIGKNSNDEVYEADVKLLEAILGYTK